MDIQHLTENDINALRELQPDDWNDITPSIEFYTKSSFCFPKKVVIDNKIAGIGTTIIHKNTAWLAHVIVHKDFRKRGIGLLITKTLVESLPANIETVYLIATELGAPVYEKAGFITESEYLFFKDVHLGENHQFSDRIIPFKYEFRNGIIQTDQLVSNEERTKFLDMYLENGFVYVQENHVRGFYLPDFGEGLIISTDPESGSALLKFHLKSNSKVSFPSENIAATAFLNDLGFKEFKRAKRMRLGIERSVKFDSIFNRISGSLG
ncbi:Acetyltransferase (GNAT) domain-containing protein [Pseudarcicella hirudinis]|uniref:Acetyltransferase (GNAT) domain-containing protein n=1 Tax=Pseudarcicella hirudinis TaxID=1079859 RepID=A0A1I5N683_9BACT|nr:GNAT family N-acetyltransferase [Pseudarcicella hirudinis]SFP17217.1 Acetyltransferase (GNAT) domain-containing protein [Pseudarcicella hirudinis]